jgi:hypothetical protein
MAAGKQANQNSVDCLVVADNNLGHFTLDFFDFRERIGKTIENITHKQRLLGCLVKSSLFVFQRSRITQKRTKVAGTARFRLICAALSY